MLYAASLSEKSGCKISVRYLKHWWPVQGITCKNCSKWFVPLTSTISETCVNRIIGSLWSDNVWQQISGYYWWHSRGWSQAEGSPSNKPTHSGKQQANRTNILVIIIRCGFLPGQLCCVCCCYCFCVNIASHPSRTIFTMQWLRPGTNVLAHPQWRAYGEHTHTQIYTCIYIYI